MTRFAYCHFCDDIRHEIGFKNSFMGIYGSEMLLESMPTYIPKICVVSFCSTSAERRFENVTSKIFHGDKLLNEQSIPQEDLIQMQDQLVLADTINEPLEKFSLGITAVIAPLLVETPSILRVVIIADGEEYTAGKLRIKLANSNNSTQ